MSNIKDLENSDLSMDSFDTKSTKISDDFDSGIVTNDITQELQTSYLRYSLSVIASRALPDVRDGLKPSQRRVLYVMRLLNLLPGGKFRKSAKICGDTSGDFHPHGEAIVYPTMVRLNQPWIMRYPLVDGQGNFGSIDGDPPGAMRYTEARMTKEATYLMEDLEKDTVDMVANYDETKKEPVIFPAKFNNLLCNGSSGIAVGMATYIPPHNLNEVIDATLMVLDNPSTTIDDIITVMPGPDFPTGGIICGLDGIRSAYHTGRGKVLLKGRYDLEEESNVNKIVIKEIPYGVNKSRLIERIAECVENKLIPEISDIRDESGRDGMRIVIEIKKGTIHDIVINKLCKLTPFRSTIACNMLALDKGMPKVMNIKYIIAAWIEHRETVITRRTVFELEKATSKLNILEGYMKVLERLDEAIVIIKNSSDKNGAIHELMNLFDINIAQAQAVIELKLYRLTNMEMTKISEDFFETKKLVENLTMILGSKSKITDIIRNDLVEIRMSNAQDVRKTEIDVDIISDESEESLIPNTEAIITLSREGFIKRLDVNELRTQNRGGQGVIGISDKKGEILQILCSAKLHDYILIFTKKGNCYWIKCWQVPEMSRRAQGINISRLIDKFDEYDKVSAILKIEDLNSDDSLLFATKQGVVKKTAIKAFSSPRKGGIIAINLDNNDEVISVNTVKKNDNILIVTRNGMAIRFDENELLQIGRSTRGVRGIKLKEGDSVISCKPVQLEDLMMFVSENGYGKRTLISKIRATHRGGIGVRGMSCTNKTGKLINAFCLEDSSNIVISTYKGKFIRIPGNIKVSGRVTQGVKLMNFSSDDDKIVDAVSISGISCMLD